MHSGRERTAKPHVPGRTLPLLPPSSAWHYIDPEGKEQGPFDAKKLINWVDLGYFGQSDLQVSGADTTELRTTLITYMQEMCRSHVHALDLQYCESKSIGCF